MKERVGAIEEFTFLPLTEGRRLHHITISHHGMAGIREIHREDRGQKRMRSGGCWLSLVCRCGPDAA